MLDTPLDTYLIQYPFTLPTSSHIGISGTQIPQSTHPTARARPDLSDVRSGACVVVHWSTRAWAGCVQLLTESPSCWETEYRPRPAPPSPLSMEASSAAVPRIVTTGAAEDRPSENTYYNSASSGTSTPEQTTRECVPIAAHRLRSLQTKHDSPS